MQNIILDFNFTKGEYAWMVYGIDNLNNPLTLKVRIEGFSNENGFYIVYGPFHEFESAGIISNELDQNQKDWAYGYADPDELMPCYEKSFIKFGE